MVYLVPVRIVFTDTSCTTGSFLLKVNGKAALARLTPGGRTVPYIVSRDGRRSASPQEYV